MMQMFFITFNPNDTKSTDGIDVSHGYCIIDVITGKWKKHDVKKNGVLIDFSSFLQICHKQSLT